MVSGVEPFTLMEAKVLVLSIAEVSKGKLL